VTVKANLLFAMEVGLLTEMEMAVINMVIGFSVIKTWQQFLELASKQSAGIFGICVISFRMVMI
jgi:hypothetical protein